MQKVVAREGREAKNLLIYHVSNENDATNVKKPPPHIRPITSHRKSNSESSNTKSSRRVVRSASTGRDKKSELQARYWALLLNNLKRAIDAIYQTVECYENLSSCQETILVLENYIRDFRSLGEWFRVSWNYEATPQPQRPQFLAWEVRKSNPAPPIRSKSLSSPSPNASGKSSPCPSFSGKSSPYSTMDEARHSPRKKLSSKPMSTDTNRTSKNINARDFKGNKSDPETTGLLPIIENGVIENPIISWNDLVEQEEAEQQLVQQSNQSPYQSQSELFEQHTVDQYCQTSGFIDEYLTLQQWRDKYENNQTNEPEKIAESTESAVLHTTTKLEEMENEFLSKNKNEPSNLISTQVTMSDDNVMSMAKPMRVDDSQSTNSTADDKTTRPDEKKIQTADRQQNPIPISRNAPILKTNNLQRPNMSRVQLANKRPIVVPKVATSLTIPTNRTRVVISKENAITYRRPVVTAMRPSGVPSNTATRLAARSRTMMDLNKSTTSHANVGKTRDFDGNASAPSKQNDRRSEPKSASTRIEDDDGWLTVKTRRRSSLHWANRFNQPSGYASLPTLTLLNEKDPNTSAENKAANNKRENKKMVKTPPQKGQKTESPKSSLDSVSKGNSSSRPDLRSTAKKPVDVVDLKSSDDSKEENITSGKTKTTKATDNQKAVPSRATILHRQKSDITGLKINTLRKEFMRIEKHKSKQKDNKKASSTDEAKPSCMPSTNNVELSTDDLKLHSIDMQQVIYVDKVDRNDMVKVDNEPDDKDELESDENQRKLLEEQICLERQILELQNTEIEIDTDDADCDTILGIEENESNDNELDEACDGCLESYEDDDLEKKYQHLLSDLSSGERIQTLATLQAFVSRHPGRAQELHQKLSSPSRRRSLHESLKKYQAKQDRAKDMRETLNKEKTVKLQALWARVEDVKVAKQSLIEEKRVRMEEKLQRYAENRNQYLKDKIRKAHDEEEKLKEIAFIKELEAQNKRFDLMEMHKEQEGRLQDLEQERQKRVEEKAAKEAAVERRRLELAKERQKRLDIIDEARRKREQRVEQKQEERDKLRQKIAREKARDREERLLALQVQQQQTTEELQRKIIQKQQDSARRHEETIEHIRQRALELSIPSRNIDENTRNENGVPEDDLSSVVSDLSIDQTKASKKKLKKLRNRIAHVSEEYMKGLDPVALYMKRDSSVPKILATMKRGGGALGMERPLGQLARIAAKPEVFDFQCLWLMDGLGTLADIIKSALEPNTELSRKSLIMAIQIYRDSCSPCIQIARHAILGNSVTTLFDALLHSLQTPDEKTQSHPIELSTELMLACTVVLSPFNTLKKPHPKVLERLPDLISYAVSIGLIEILSRRCVKVREPIEIHQTVVLSILACLGLLTKFAEICSKDSASTKFLNVVKSTECLGTISLLYATIAPVGECIPPRTISIAAASFNLILTLANLSLTTFQSILSRESLSLQFLDVITILLKYCGPKSKENAETQAVIVDLIATIGFFCANNKQNQNLLISEQSLVIIKSLSKLPKTFDIVLYPTLLTIICDNDGAKTAIGREFDLKCIEDFQNSESGKNNKMLSMLNAKSKNKQTTDSN